MTVVALPNQCESCLAKPATCEVSNDPFRPFLVCASCDHRLRTRSLRPLEWFRLAAPHGWSSYLLCDDFYDDNGQAAAPEATVDEAESFPYPSEEAWTASIALALDVAYTKWSLPPALVSVFAGARERTLDEINKTLRARTNPVLASRACEIAAHALGRVAETWIRARWTAPDPRTVFSLSQASAACLPVPEGLNRVINFLSLLDDDARHDHILSLSWFSDARAVDALESLVRSPLTETWGRVAAACGLDWARARSWLERGRPLSLIALDALTFFVRYDTLLLRSIQPKLRDAPDVSELERYLTGYAERDPVPRVKRAVSFIVANAHALATGSPTPACG